MFSAFGSMINDDLETGLIETFSSNNYSDATNNCYLDGERIMCRNNNGSSSNNNTTTQVQEDPDSSSGSNNTPTQDSSPQLTQPRVIRQLPDSRNPSVTEQFQNMTQQSQEESSESSSSESDSDPELEEADNEDTVQRKSEGNNSRVRAMYERERPQTTPASSVADDQDDPVVTTGSVVDESDEEDDEEDSTESTGPAVTEQFTNMKSVAQKATSSNLILKGVLFSCVFYILVHDETRKKVMKELTKSMKFLKSDHYEYISVLIFFVLYYIISIFL